MARFLWVNMQEKNKNVCLAQLKINDVSLPKKLQNSNKKSKILINFKNFTTKLQKSVFVLHPLFLVVGVVLCLCGLGKLFVIYTICALLHEGGHAVVARRLGYKCMRVKLMPYGAVLEAESDEFTPRDEILISIAGPVVNIVLVFVCVCFWWVEPGSYYFTCDFVVANLSCGIFNLLPIFPLDGGRVVLSMFSVNHDRKFAVKTVKTITIIFAIILFFLFIILSFFTLNLTIGVMSIMLVVSALNEDKNTAYKKIVSASIKRKKLMHGLNVKSVLIGVDMPLKKVISKLSFNHYNFIIVCDQNFNIVSTITETQFDQLMGTCPPFMEIGRALKQKQIIDKGENRKL